MNDGIDGTQPSASMIAVNGTLYGTTVGGGEYNVGTVFSLTPDGRDTILHSFDLFKGGLYPLSDLYYLDGFLYGTTKQSAPFGSGTVFRMDLSGKFETLYEFKGPPDDGAYPLGGLIAVNGTLYGTTNQGGKSNDGTVFSLTNTGHESVVHAFSGPDGKYPRPAMIAAGGKLYGVTDVGGTKNLGVVFALDTRGNESVVHSFKGDDGSYPEGKLHLLQGALYGTTFLGGAHRHGTVFRMTLAGEETLLHSFKGTDGACAPVTGVIDANGMLYGTTYGIAPDCSSAGTIYRITTTGNEQQLHAFGTGQDGANPFGAPVLMNHKLYGTTTNGGQHGVGTAYSISP